MTGIKFPACGKTLLIGAILESLEPRSVGFIVSDDVRCHLRWKSKR